KPVLYSASTGSLENVPLIAGRTYTVEVRDLNPLCYTYSGEISVTEENTDLSKIIAAFGSLPGAPSTPAPDTTKPDEEVDPEAAPGVVAGESDAQKVERARVAVELAETALLRLAGAAAAVEEVVKEVRSPVCSRNAPFAPVHGRWTSIADLRAQVTGKADLALARSSLQSAREILGDVTDEAAKGTVPDDLADASGKADELEKKLATLVPDVLIAEGTMRAAAETQQFKTQAFLPANTQTAQIVLRATELRPAEGKTATTSELKTTLPVRRGMRVFLSAGFLASMASSHDYARVNRPCSAGAEPDCEGTYSTYANKGAGRPFAFSPVLQVNVAFRDIWSSGVALHTSAGVAARSVNGTVSPEFILGAGTGLVDRLLLTAGIHIARDERLLLGEPGQVRKLSVPDQITDADAVGTTWRPAFVLTTTIRLND
ncbi:MAG TPA: hypothetical protein VFR81_21495, partial [Longimicrobium sp.]|nr:hypothetical protein [Longimicrobium sp.]